MNRSLRRAVWLTLAVGALMALLVRFGLGLGALMLLALGAGLLAALLPWFGPRALEALQATLRSASWARQEGRYHSFGGVMLEVEDDGRHVWLGGSGLMRALGRQEPDEVCAARHAGCWRRNPQGRLMLRVDAVVQVLATQPGRHDPRVQRLRRYLQRELLFPAEQRPLRR